MLDIYIDADACPVKEEAYRVAHRYQLRVFVVSHHLIRVPEETWITPVVVTTGFDAVDNWIEAEVKKKDIVITNDILLAQRIILKEATAIDPRGKILDEENIGDAVATRELLSELRQSGDLKLGPKKMGKNHRSNFLSAFDTLINKIKHLWKGMPYLLLGNFYNFEIFTREKVCRT